MKLVKNGSETTLSNCPAGLFSYRGTVAFKARNTEFEGTTNHGLGYLIENGKVLRHDLNYRDRMKLMVQPLLIVKE